MEPGPQLDELVQAALAGRVKNFGTIPAYSTDIALAFKAVEVFFGGGEAIHLQQDLDGQWIAGLMHWTLNTPTVRIWDFTAYRLVYKGRTAAHAISLCIGAFYNATGEDDCPFTAWEHKDTLRVHDTSGEAG